MTNIDTTPASIRAIQSANSQLHAAMQTSDAAVLGYMVRMSNNYNEQINGIRSGMEQRFHNIQDINKRQQVIAALKSMTDHTGNEDKKIDCRFVTQEDVDRAVAENERRRQSSMAVGAGEHGLPSVPVPTAGSFDEMSDDRGHIKEGIAQLGQALGCTFPENATLKDICEAVEAAGIELSEVGITRKDDGAMEVTSGGLTGLEEKYKSALNQANSDNQMSLSTMQSLMSAKNADFQMVSSILSAESDVRKAIIGNMR